MVQALFADVIGQPTAIHLLSQAIAQDRFAPAYLFVGPAGVGRQLTAICFTERLLSCQSAVPGLRRRIVTRNHPDLLWVEPTYLHQGKPVTRSAAAKLGIQRKQPPQIRLSQIRDIASFLARPPLMSERSVVVMDGAETLTEAAANGVLKTLEEPGPATLILLATDGATLLPTIVSRCQQIPFRRLSQADMEAVLTRVGQGEILQQPDIIALSQGSPGGAIAAWQRYQTLPSDLLAALSIRPTGVRQALELARRISKDLEMEAQLWLIDYLQQAYWRTQHTVTVLTQLEMARSHLRRFVQPRLVWEVTLMAIATSS